MDVMLSCVLLMLFVVVCCWCCLCWFASASSLYCGWLFLFVGGVVVGVLFVLLLVDWSCLLL